MDFAALQARAVAGVTSAREAIEDRIVPIQVRAREAWIDPPRVSLWVPIIIVCASLAILPIATWLKGREVDKAWRAKIAASSAAVRAIVEQGGQDAEASDAAIVKALGDTDGKLARAETELRTSRQVDGCPVIPRRCLGGVR